MTIRVVIADDQELLRLGFRMILDQEEDIEVVGEAGNGEDAVEATERTHPDVVLMDVRMPGVDGIEATRRIVDGTPSTRVLVLTTFDLDDHAFGALRAGASGFLLKDVPPEELTAGIRLVASGDAVVSPAYHPPPSRRVRPCSRRPGRRRWRHHRRGPWRRSPIGSRRYWWR